MAITKQNLIAAINNPSFYASNLILDYCLEKGKGWEDTQMFITLCQMRKPHLIGEMYRYIVDLKVKEFGGMMIYDKNNILIYIT